MAVLCMKQGTNGAFIAEENNWQCKITGSIAGTTSVSSTWSISQSNCLSIFQLGLVKGIITEDLAFCDPSENDDLNTPPLLQSHTITNTSFLEYQDWIVTLLLEADKMDCGMFEHCETIKSQLLDGLQNKWTKLEDIKLCAWRKYNTA
ncbi:hypothetical protein H4582DRAFT_2060402 [Lactarius indigo]|nr:hypothetical protein H4582DRAFT_2060402 [Lactarius indigo]